MRLIVLCDEQGKLLSMEKGLLLRILHGEVVSGINAPNMLLKALDGQDVLVNITGMPIHNGEEGIVGAVIITHDITSLQQIEQRARTGMNAQPESADEWVKELASREAQRRMEEFISVASHELRTPITTIKMGIQLTRRWLKGFAGYDAASGEKLASMHELLERSERQVGTLNRLVGDLLDVSRMRSRKFDIRPDLCDLTRIVHDAVYEQSQGEMKRAILLDIAACCQVVTVMADADRIGQVITSYITNALKYSAADRPVQVSVQLESAQSVRVSVGDEGPGLSTEEQERIWERFYQLDRVRVRSGSNIGLGLGLHISRTIIEYHHGQVGVDSVLGEGSVFWFTLPLAEVSLQDTSYL
jgi:signal transduction histidine kinase